MLVSPKNYLAHELSPSAEYSRDISKADYQNLSFEKKFRDVRRTSLSVSRHIRKVCLLLKFKYFYDFRSEFLLGLLDVQDKVFFNRIIVGAFILFSFATSCITAIRKHKQTKQYIVTPRYSSTPTSEQQDLFSPLETMV